MSLQRDGIIDPPIDELLGKVDSKYQLVIYAAKARVKLTRTTPTSVMGTSTTT